MVKVLWYGEKSEEDIISPLWKVWMWVVTRKISQCYTVQGEEVWMYSPYLTHEHVRYMERYDKRFKGYKIRRSPKCMITGPVCRL